jgi:D-alanine--poly(phosphoribitol) ligase subunit 1
VLIVDRKNSERLTPELLQTFSGPILIADGETAYIGGRLINGFDRLPQTEKITEPCFVDAEAGAYLVFTSGTTGHPNGVVIGAGNLDFAIRSLSKRYPFVENDRFSQFFDLSFDFSVMDLFVPWSVGASTYVVPDVQKMAPGRFIVDHSLTIWTCVPSLITFMAQMKLLKPGLFPSLRYSFFSGEALTEQAARLWKKTTPNGALVNFYGQTEAPIGSLFQNYVQDSLLGEENQGVPLGSRLEGVHVSVVSQAGTFLEPGAKGELVISGPHVAAGYLNNPQRTREKFRVLEHPRYGLRSWYVTGDLAREDGKGVFHFLGRADNELKIKGHRVLLEELEHYLRQCSGCHLVAVTPCYSSTGRAEALVGFVVGGTIDEKMIKGCLRGVLPQALIPRRIHSLEKMPLNQNGKVDRKELQAIYSKMG